MLKWSIFNFGLVFALFCTVCLSCKKDAISNQFQRLIGKWQEVQYATDDNNNGVLESNELHNISTDYVAYLTFKSDSTGIETITINNVTQAYPFNWVLYNSDSLQRNGVGHDLISYNIVQITSLNLTLMTTSDKGIIWYVYNKK